jgi:hypothetical protein
MDNKHETTKLIKKYRTGLHRAALRAQRSQNCTNKLLVDFFLITLSTDHINFVLAKFFLFLARDAKSEETVERQSNKGLKIKVPMIT